MCVWQEGMCSGVPSEARCPHAPYLLTQHAAQAEQMVQGLATLGASPAWSPTNLKAFVGVSGAYDLAALAEHLHRRGLYKNLFDRIMSLSTDAADPARGAVAKCGRECNVGACANGNGSGGGGCRIDVGQLIDGGAGTACEGMHGCSGSSTANASHDASGCRGGARPAYDALSPLQAAQRLPPGAADLLPYVLLIHGTADKTVPAEGSAKLCKALQVSLVSGRVELSLVSGFPVYVLK